MAKKLNLKPNDLVVVRGNDTTEATVFTVVEVEGSYDGFESCYPGVVVARFPTEAEATAFATSYEES